MKQFITFLIVGGGNTVLGLSIMFILNMITHNPYLSNVFAYVLCFFTSFWAHDAITFKGIKEKKPWRIIPYAVIYAAAFLANYIALSLMVSLTGWPVEAIFIATSAIFAITSFSLNKVFVFAEREISCSKRWWADK